MEPMQPIKPLKFNSAGPLILRPDETPLTAHVPPTGTQRARIFVESRRPTQSAARSAKSTIWLLGEAKQEPLHLRFCPSLSWEDRVMGFAGCFVIGITLSLSSMISFPQLLAGHPGPFALKYSFGNVLGLTSTAFLVGPKTQLKNMMAPVRLGATVVYLLTICLTLFFALVLRVAPITLLSMVVQFCALLWYCASYIPFGRQCLRSCIGRVFRL